MAAKSTNTRGPLAAVGVGAALVVCCALPLLLAAGALGALGGVLWNPWLLAGAAAVVVATLAVTVTRVRRRGARTPNGSSPQDEDCCPPPWRDHQATPLTPPKTKQHPRP